MQIRFWLSIWVFGFFSCMWAADSQSLETVSVQLNWKYQFEFAGFIAAKEKGYYRDAGLEVELREYHNGVDIVSDVLEGKSTYGIYNANLVIEDGVIRPIVLMATYLQHSPLIFVARKGIRNPADMIGKRIMVTQDEVKNASLGLLLKHFEITAKNARFVNHTYNTQTFIDGKVDVMSAFSSNELYELDRLHVPYEIIDPAQYGFMMSGANLFTSQKEAIEHTGRTQRFIDATNRGWEYAFKHPHEIITILKKRYGVTKSTGALEFEARETRRLFMRDFFKIGEVNPDLCVRAYKQLMQAGVILPDQKLGVLTFDEIAEKMKTTLSLTSDEKQYLLQKKSIRMCVDPDWYPFEAIWDGRHIGISADVMKTFEKQIGIPIRMVPVENWEESVEKAKRRECDIFSLASSTPEREKYMEFTTPYINLPIVLVTTMDKPFTEGIEQLKGKKIAVVEGYAIGEKLRFHYPELELVEVKSISEGLKAVQKKEVYGYVDNLMVVSSYIQKEYTGVLKISSRLEENVALGIGTRKDEPILNRIFEKLVRHRDERSVQAIYDKWAPTVEEVNGFNRQTVLQGLVLIVLIGGVFFWRYYELQRYNEKLLKLSITDPLTGLFNRLRLDERLAEEDNRLRRYPDYSFSLMILDIDHFKQINDRYGHITGDMVLKTFSKLIKDHIRTTDIAGRWGGEEFMIILPHTDKNSARTVAENLRHRIEKFDFGLEHGVTASIGIGEAKRDMRVEELVRRIDDTLYRAKEKGRNRTETVA
ncbi:MAG: diguanylate cyclase [Sulfuricurvum sp.]